MHPRPWWSVSLCLAVACGSEPQPTAPQPPVEEPTVLQPQLELVSGQLTGRVASGLQGRVVFRLATLDDTPLAHRTVHFSIVPPMPPGGGPPEVPATLSTESAETAANGEVSVLVTFSSRAGSHVLFAQVPDTIGGHTVPEQIVTLMAQPAPPVEVTPTAAELTLAVGDTLMLPDLYTGVDRFGNMSKPFSNLGISLQPAGATGEPVEERIPPHGYRVFTEPFDGTLHLWFSGVRQPQLTYRLRVLP